MRSALAHARRQEGAVAIEAMAVIFLLTAALVMVCIAGSGFANLTLLNSTAQSMSLSAQTTMDQWCSPAASADQCVRGAQEAILVSNKILAGQQRMMIFPETAGSSAVQSSPTSPDAYGGGQFPLIRPSSRAPIVQAPGPGGSMKALPRPLSAGWGYSYAGLEQSFKAPGLPAIPLRASSLTLSYRDPR